MRLAGCAALLALLVAALPAPAADLEKPNLRLAVGGKALVAYLPLTIAEQRGYFKKEGLDVEISDFQAGNKALQALVGGSADVGCGAYEHTIYMAVKGFPLKTVALQAVASTCNDESAPGYWRKLWLSKSSAGRSPDVRRAEALHVRFRHGRRIQHALSR
jgi:ABC-type nitrate/sulfonate/bicarbonate transport system substrate-binding protein